MSKSHNPCPTLLLSCCHLQDQDAITRAILQNTSTQFQFRTDGPAEDSDECAEDKTTEGFR